MSTAELITALIQLGCGTAAWRLANALKLRVDASDRRIDDHEVRIVRLEKA